MFMIQIDDTDEYVESEIKQYGILLVGKDRYLLLKYAGNEVLKDGTREECIKALIELIS